MNKIKYIFKIFTIELFFIRAIMEIFWRKMYNKGKIQN